MGRLNLILFSRAPVAGESKTRLAEAIGPEAALAIHVNCLNDLIETCGKFCGLGRGLGREAPGGGRAAAQATPGGGVAAGPPMETTCHLFVTPEGSQARFAEAGVTWPAHFRVRSQAGRDLGQRMANSFADVFREAPGTPAMLVGSDLPLLDVPHLEQAATALKSADVVFGGTEDGGYYLIGMKASHPALFELSGWGGRDVLRRTLAAAAAQGLSTALTATLPDVDSAEDLAAVRAHPLFAQLAHRRAVRFISGLLD